MQAKTTLTHAKYMSKIYPVVCMSGVLASQAHYEYSCVCAGQKIYGEVSFKKAEVNPAQGLQTKFWSHAHTPDGTKPLMDGQMIQAYFER